MFEMLFEFGMLFGFKIISVRNNSRVRNVVWVRNSVEFQIVFVFEMVSCVMYKKERRYDTIRRRRTAGSGKAASRFVSSHFMEARSLVRMINVRYFKRRE